MKMTLKRDVCLSVFAFWLGLVGPLSAQTVLFDNRANDLHSRFNPGTFEVGDEITLAGIGNMSLFSFEFWGTNTAQPDNSTFAGAIQADVRFYYNDGTPFNGYNTPGTKFYDSGWFPVGSPTARNTFVFSEGVDFPGGGISITSPDITWSIQFSGMGATDSVGVDLYSPPVVGTEVGDFGDYWQFVGGIWTLQTNTVAAMDFGALIETPEPSSMALALVGGVSLLISMRWLRRKD
jgi:hypothetical protein